jgi:hypothetical protein
MSQSIINIYNKVLFYDDKWLAIKKNIKLTNINKVIANSTIPNFNLYPRNIQDYMQGMNYNLCHGKLTIKDKIIDITIFHNNYKNLHNIFRYIYIWISIICDYDTYNNCSNHLKVYIALNPQKKFLPKRGEPIDRQNANTAFTFSCKRNNEIHIFRQEEWFKVFIHETFHSFCLDFSDIDNIQTLGNNIFSIKTNLYLFECYAETWATIIHSIFVLYNQEPIKQSFTIDIYSKSNKLFETEIMFSLFQCCKIMKHHNIDYNMLCNSKNIQYSENTPVMSYYFFKSILFFHYDTFITWCQNNNDNLLTFNNNNVHKYANLILRLSRDDKYIEYINYLYNKYEKIITKKNDDDISLRMTIHNIN